MPLGGRIASETISKRFEELDVCGKFTLKSKLREIAFDCVLRNKFN